MVHLPALLVAAGLASAAGPRAGDPPNVLVVLMDDVGRDKIAAYGDHPDPPATPNIDALAGKGVLFRSAWAYPVCSPTRAALLTGRHADRTGIGSLIQVNDSVRTPLHTGETILPEVLPDHRSTAFGKWHLRDTGESLDHPLRSGFDAAIGFAGRIRYFKWQMHVDGEKSEESGYYPTALAERVVDSIEGATEPWFAYYCTSLAHSPYHVPPDGLYRGEPPVTIDGKHRAMVEALDHVLGTVLERVDLETTYVFLIGDNGSPAFTIRRPWDDFHGKGSCYEPSLRVPFVVAGPGVARGVECDELVHVTDVFATVLELVGRPPAASGAEDSISFATLLADPEREGARDHLYVHVFPFSGTTREIDDVRAIRDRRWKLIENRTRETVELYDLEADPMEVRNLLAEEPDEAAEGARDRLLGAMPAFR